MSEEATYLSFCRVLDLALGDRRLSRTDLAVLVAIGKHAKPDGSGFPSQELLGSIAGVGRRRANKAVQTLIKAGYLMVLGRDVQGKRRCLYQLLPGMVSADPAGGAGTKTKCANGGAQGAAPVDNDGGYPQTAHSQNGNPQDSAPPGATLPPQGPDEASEVRQRGRTILRRGGRTNQTNKITPPISPPADPPGKKKNGPSPGATEAMPVEGKGRGRGPRKRGAVGPAGGRAGGSPGGRGARSVPSTGPPS